MAASFVPLHVHSHYSLLRALPKIGDLVAHAKAEGVEALALTDLGNLYGAIEFYKACKDAGIKPIIGLESVMEGGKHVLLYAKNRAGYQNLLKIVTKSHLNSPGNPIVTSSMLEEHGDGLITLDPKDTDVPMREVYYLQGEDRRAWETLRAIENRGPVDSGNIDDEEDNFAFPTSSEMEEKFGAAALQKTLDIAAECNVDLELGKWFFPDIDIPAGATYDQELRRLVEEGIKRRFIQETDEIRTRIEYEYEIITKKGYSSYFLVVADLLAYARENKILTTIRGSVAGSLTTYVLGITNVNPLAYKLPFERFLNPERPSAPDIDMDYADNRRDEVIEYARKKYGADKVAQIGTFGTMLARGVVRDVARALGLPYGLGDAIAKEIPMGSQGFPMTLERAIAENPELAKMYKQDPQVREIIELGKKIEGCARHVGVHAAGVVISPTALVDYTPLQLDPKGGKLITQYDMYSIDENNAGLLKFDFLGIKNLAILAHSVELVEKTRGVLIDIENVPVDDARTFEMLALGQTEGLFQLNGSGMTRFLKELKPSTIHDINAMVALYRPGPMETIPQYIERKHNPAMVSYADPRMKEYLEFSHGVLVYQDDVLLTAITLGGYSWLEADKLRKAMGKKIPEVMEAEREKLIKGFIEYGKLKPQLAERLWKLIEPFAAYGFNKAHAASYGKVAYQTAYMKANYPVEYMAAVLTADAGDVDTVSIMVNECKRMGVPVLAPDINESFGDFTVILAGAENQAMTPQRGAGGDMPPQRRSAIPAEPEAARSEEGISLQATDSIRFGLYSIKNFGSGVADSIINERKNGRFTSLSDFLTRVADNGLNKKGLESLIMCGALDSFAERGAMLAHIEQLLQFHRDAAAEHMHDSLFADVAGHSEIKLPPAPAATMDQRLVWEKELLGLYVSGHPLDKFKEKLDKRPLNLAQIKERSYPGTTTVIAGMIEDLRILLTKNGDQMAFIKLADKSGSVEAVVFPKSYVEYKSILRPEACIAIKGRVSNRNGEFSVVTEALKAL